MNASKSVPRGRRPLPADLRRSEFVGVRFTLGEVREADRAARHSEVTLSAFIRAASLEAARRLVKKKS